jgi:hypothetical protein
MILVSQPAWLASRERYNVGRRAPSAARPLPCCLPCQPPSECCAPCRSTMLPILRVLVLCMLGGRLGMRQARAYQADRAIPATTNLTIFLPQLMVTGRGGKGAAQGNLRRLRHTTRWSTIVAADAVGAAGSAAVDPSPPPVLYPAVVEVNTMWAPFATGCTVVNQSSFGVTWRCSQPAVRGAPGGTDSITCDCNQHSMRYPVPEMRTKCACHRMLEVAVGRLNLSASALAMAANDTARLPNRTIRAALGGFFYSLPPAGRCGRGGSSGSTSCSWRVMSAAGQPKNSSCLAIEMRSLAHQHAAACFAACPKRYAVAAAIGPLSPCYRRCVAVGLATAGPIAVERAWQAIFAGSVCSTPTSAAVMAPSPTHRLPSQQAVTGAAQLQLYRLAPRSLAVDMVNANSGDVLGDIFFGVVEAQLQCFVRAGGKPFSCNDNPMNEGKALRLNTAGTYQHSLRWSRSCAARDAAARAVYTRFTTEVNTLFSDYTMCNAVQVCHIQ